MGGGGAGVAEGEGEGDGVATPVLNNVDMLSLNPVHPIFTSSWK
jgi:hypothetical protein